MSKKPRGKSPNAAGGDQKWDTNITRGVINDSEWNVSFAMVVANEYEDLQLIRILGQAIAIGKRKLFTFVSQEDLFRTVLEFGNSKVKKGKDGPANSEICEAVKPFIDAGTEIPLPLLAKLIKFRIMDIKAEDMRRIEMEKKGKGDVGGKGGKKDAKGKDARKDSGKDGGKGGKKGAAGKKSPEPPSAKGATNLRKRGEENPDANYIDDEPEDGASRYIILTGFDQPHLVTYLSDCGLTPDAIIKMHARSYDKLKPQIIAPDFDDDAKSVDEKEIALQEERLKKMVETNGFLKRFWRDIILLVRSSRKLRHVAMLDYEIPDLYIPGDMDDSELKMECGMNMFEDLACLLYDLIDFRRQWKNYLNNLEVLSVPITQATHAAASTTTEGNAAFPSGGPPSPGGAENPVTNRSGADASAQVVAPENPLLSGVDDGPAVVVLDPVDMRYYNDLLSNIPMESTSVELIMHAILEQVDATTESKPLPSEQKRAPREDGLNALLADQMADLCLKLALSDSDVQRLEGDLKATKTPRSTMKIPDLVHPKDEITCRTMHLEIVPEHSHSLPGEVYPLDPLSAELTSLKQSRPLSSLLELLPRNSDEMARRRAARLQELIQVCAVKGHSAEDVDHALKQFVLECIPLTGTDLNGTILSPREEGRKVSHEHVAWDDPYPFFRGLHEYFIEEENEEKRRQEALEELRRQKQAELEEQQPLHEVEGEYRKTTSGSILRRSASANSRDGRTSSRSSSRSSLESTSRHRQESGVHFEEIAIQKSLRDSPPPQLLEEDGALEFFTQHSKEDSQELLQQENEEALKIVLLTQQRVLDEWCFAEHMEPHVLLQTLRLAIHRLPFMDTYYQRRDHTLILILHNPFHEDILSNHREWQQWVHSNVAFRNYLEHVVDRIEGWTREQEALYEASKLRKEVEKTIQEDEDAEKQVTSTTAKRGRGKSPPKKDSGSPRNRSRSGSRAGSSASQNADTENPFIRANSLKAAKLEQIRIQKEKEEEEKRKSEKRSKSPAKKKGAEDAAEKTGGKSSPAKGKQAATGAAKGPEVEQNVTGDPQPEEERKHFTGYDLSDQMGHLMGEVTHMFPTDGGTIRVERVDTTLGSIQVRALLLKDDHVFTVHITDPLSEISGLELSAAKFPLDESSNHQAAEVGNDGASQNPPNARNDPKQLNLSPIHEDTQRTYATSHEQNDRAANKALKNQSSQPVSFFGSFTGQFSDGLIVSYSNYGDNGTPDGIQRPAPSPYEVPKPHAESEEQAPQSPTSKAKAAGGRNRKASTAKSPSKEEPANPPVAAVPPAESGHKDDGENDALGSSRGGKSPVRTSKTSHALKVTQPDGQVVQFNVISSRDSSSTNVGGESKLQVKMFYVGKTGKNNVKKRQTAFNEIRRCVTMDGQVIKIINDGSTQILFPDGSTAVSGGSDGANVPPFENQFQQTNRSEQGKTSDTQNVKKKPVKGGKGGKVQEIELEEVVGMPRGSSGGGSPKYWLITTPSGERWWSRQNMLKSGSVGGSNLPGKADVESGEKMVVKDKPLALSMATDPSSGQIMYTREDHVVMIHWADADMTITEHADGTRITQFLLYQELPDTSDKENLENFEDEGAVHEKDDVSAQVSAGPQQWVAQKFVRIECPGYASLLINQNTGEVEAKFGSSLSTTSLESGSVLVASPLGQYILQHATGGQLCVHNDGCILYTSHVPQELAYLQPNGSPTYVFRHHGKTILEVVDNDGNAFSVDPSGNCHALLASTGDNATRVENASNDQTVLEETDADLYGEEDSNNRNSKEGEGQTVPIEINDSTTSQKLRIFGQHAPRFFILHSDGSGVELLRFRDVAEYINRAERESGISINEIVNGGNPNQRVAGSNSNPADYVPPPKTAFRKEVWHENGSVLVAYSALRPFHRSLSESWLVDYVQENIIPSGLRSRDLLSLPPQERKIPGPKFGSNVARGLRVAQFQEEERRRRRLAQYRVQNHCPSQLEFRQILQYQPLNEEEREFYLQRLFEYAEKVQTRLLELRSLQVMDQRSEAERLQAWALLSKAAAVQGFIPLGDNIKDLYKKLTALPPEPTPITSHAKRSEADWERDRREREMEKQNRQALRSRDIPKFFLSDYGKDFLLTQVPDLQKLAKKLDVFPPSNPASRNSSGQLYKNDPSNQNGVKERSVMKEASTNNVSLNNSVFDLGKNDSRKTSNTKVNSNSQPPRQPVRNPSAHGYNRRATVQVKKPVFAYYDPNLPAEVIQSLNQPRTNHPISVSTNVVGKSRIQPVSLPHYLFSGRPNAHVNQRQAWVEDPVRIPIYYSTLIGSPLRSQLALRASRGLNVLPSRVDLGLLREGYTYRYGVQLVNTGIETCHYRIKPPPPSSGISVLYERRPVPAGLSATLTLQVYAIACGLEGQSGVGQLKVGVGITSETDHMTLYISGHVMTGSDYDQHENIGLAPGVQLCRKGPPPKHGVFRSRRLQEIMNDNA